MRLATPMSKTYLLRMTPQELVRWKADAARRDLSLAEWIRMCLNDGAGRDPEVAYQRISESKRKPERGIPEKEPVILAPPARTEEAIVGRGRFRALDSLAVEAERERARELALKQGRCTADVASGTRCKLCGRVH